MQWQIQDFSEVGAPTYDFAKNCIVCETICDARASRVWHGKIFAHFAKTTNSQFDYPRIPLPTPKNENLVRTWHIECQIPPPWKFNKGLQLKCVETNRCIPQGYCLVLLCRYIQCIKLWTKVIVQLCYLRKNIQSTLPQSSILWTGTIEHELQYFRPRHIAVGIWH